jgi:hypothetical protein
LFFSTIITSRSVRVRARSSASGPNRDKIRDKVRRGCDKAPWENSVTSN